MASRKSFIRFAITDRCDRESLDAILKKSPTHISFRDKELKGFEDRAKEFISYLSNRDLILYLHRDIELAKRLGFDGVHLKSSQFDSIKFAKSLDLLTIISTHKRFEIELAKKNGADMIFYSPIFYTPNKSKPKGLENLKNICKNYDIDIIALGGIISDKEAKEIEKLGVSGFASIRYFR